jgi:multicomponent Na+:H+ antiporter subunit B
MMLASYATAPTIILDLALMAILIIVAFSIVRMRSLFAIVMLQGVYSLVSAAWFVSLDAVDVAFTEAAVGAGVSTVLMLAAMLLANRKSDPVPISKQIAPLLVVIFAGLAMFYAIGDMPAYGDVNSPANTGVGMDYIDRTTKEIHIPNVVTAVLASYRGYDTFGEAVVIFSAGLGVLLLLGLNGNAGRWTASPSGQNIYPPMAPSANSRLSVSSHNSKSVTSSAVKEPSSSTTRKSKRKRFKDKGNN